MSDSLFEEAKAVIAGGVNSPVRAFKSVGGVPIFVERGQGPYLFDTDSKQYIDFVCSWGALIAGHAHPNVVEAVQQAAADGLSFGAPTVKETELAQKICEMVPSVQKLRLVNSGTEATMSAIRLARGFTGRSKIIKFEGCYHGHVDSLLVKAGSGALSAGEPTSAGIHDALAADTICLEYNDCKRIAEVFAEIGEEIAAVIVEPVAGNMNMVLPKDDFLPSLRQLCDEHESVLIFDEVMTGFRLGMGGAQEVFAVTPDLSCFGKVIGGGMPIGAFGGREDIMAELSPNGPVYQAGTLSGNPIAVSAGLATLDIISAPNFYENLSVKVKSLVLGIKNAAQAYDIPVVSHGLGGMFGLFFTEQEDVHNLSEVMQCDSERYKQFFHAMLDAGVYLAPSAFEAGFVSSAHSENDIADTIERISTVFQSFRD